MIAFRKNVRFRKQIFFPVGFRHYKGISSMDRKRVGAFLLIAALGMTAGCTSFSASRFNPFNHNKVVNEGCPEVGTGPVCEGSVMGAGERLPADSGYMMPSDGSFMQGNMLPGPATGPIIQSPPPGTNFMPPANGTSVAPSRLAPVPPAKPMPNN
jgi:hypothetical protein